MSRRREYESRIAEELKRAGVATYEFRNARGGGHPRCVFTHNGRKLTVIYPASPSDSWRGAQNGISRLRRMLTPPE